MKRLRRLTSIIVLLSILSGAFSTTVYAAGDVTYDNDTTGLEVEFDTGGSSDYDSTLQTLSDSVSSVAGSPSGNPNEYATAVKSRQPVAQGVSTFDSTSLPYVMSALTYAYIYDSDSGKGDYYKTTVDEKDATEVADLKEYIDLALNYDMKTVSGATTTDFKNHLEALGKVKDKDGKGVTLSLDYGILKDNYITTPKADSGEYSVSVLAGTGIYSCLFNYAYYATTWRADLMTRYSTGELMQDSDLSVLKSLEMVYTAFSGLFPMIDEYSNIILESEDANKSLTLVELWEEQESSLNNYTPEFDALGDTVDLLKEPSYPLSDFYKINSIYGIGVVEYDKIRADIDVDMNAFAVEEAADDSRKTVQEILAEDKYENVFMPELKAIFNLDASSSSALNGRASSLTCVSMSEYIQEGMANSSTYVPLKTNVYSPNVLAQLDDDFKNEFFYKFGFMRKALMKSNSSTAAVDFYNANGKNTGTTSVCTLRDIVESDGKDLVLYVDSNFYNADAAIEEGNELLKALRTKQVELSDTLLNYADVYGINLETTDASFLSGMLQAVSDKLITPVIIKLVELVGEVTDTGNVWEEYIDAVESEYNFDISELEDIGDIRDMAHEMRFANNQSATMSLDYKVLKHDGLASYSNLMSQVLSTCEESDYREIKEHDLHNSENYDTLVLPSRYITDYMDGKSSYKTTVEDEVENQVTTNVYTSYDRYTPMLPLAYVSALYRYPKAYSLANSVAVDNPVFISSDDLCGIKEADQWYRNTIINYALVQNLKSAATLDFNYVVDLDCPVYIDVFGNILSESGLVVIPAACNMTLHSASYKDHHVAAGLYSVYGKEYHVPLSCTGASTALFPFFTIDEVNQAYIINGVNMNLAGTNVKYNELSPNDPSTQLAIKGVYLNYLTAGGSRFTMCNWPVMVNIINEVMRGAPVENINKDIEGLHTSVIRNKAGIVAAVKLEELINSLEGQMSNTLLSIPDFSRSDHTEYIVAFLIKILIVVITAVIIIGIYRDGVAGTLGWRTFYKSIASVMLTFAAVCLIPAVFQLTYYAANKFLLHDEAMRILMYNLEKYQSGVEIGMLDTTTPESTNDMSLQLDWISVPWYDQLENMLYGSSLRNLDKVKEEAYRQSPIYDNYDVELYNDGVYVNTDELFSAISIDYTFNEGESASGANGLYLYANNKLQTASFYSPYYVFLRVLCGNINEYNYYHDSYNYTTKFMSGNRLKTVGLCNTYFTTKGFMEEDEDIMHLYEIYGDPLNTTYDRAQLFTPGDVLQFEKSRWYYHTLENKGLDKRVEIMNKYARDFVAKNKDLLTKVTDETFIKVMALNMAIKYNQVFGINSANAIEIYNMDSNDLLRLSVVKTEDAVLAAPMSYSRFIYNFGGEPAVYAAAILTMIMWVGSFIKPLCTIVVFISVFMSIVVFRVILRKPSHNLFGYLVTVLLLCSTNILHAVLLKVSTYLPNTGLSTLGCLIFLIVGQVVYLLTLAYVTGVSLKDWYNLGATDYIAGINAVRSTFVKNGNSNLNSNVPYHDNGKNYYTDLVKQQRSRTSNSFGKTGLIHSPAAAETNRNRGRRTSLYESSRARDASDYKSLDSIEPRNNSKPKRDATKQGKRVDRGISDGHVLSDIVLPDKDYDVYHRTDGDTIYQKRND